MGRARGKRGDYGKPDHSLPYRQTRVQEKAREMKAKAPDWIQSTLRAVVPTLVIGLCAAAIKLYVDVAQLKAQNVTDARLTRLEARMDETERQVQLQWHRREEKPK